MRITAYTADPAPLVHNGRVYLYTGHDEDGSTWFTSTSTTFPSSNRGGRPGNTCHWRH